MNKQNLGIILIVLGALLLIISYFADLVDYNFYNIGALVIIIAGIVNIFVKSSMFDFIICIVGVLLFVGLTAWDAQKIRLMLEDAPDAGEGAQKIALLGALSLYLDFINLFIHLLRLLGNRN
jgi:FtsH-binding integral membrane protein